MRRLVAAILKLPFYAYRYAISPLLASNCRFQPTCSAYALEALDRHHPVRALSLILRRVIRCRPGGDSGFDPVPPVEKPQKS